jgi:hypothetical protein
VKKVKKQVGAEEEENDAHQDAGDGGSDFHGGSPLGDGGSRLALRRHLTTTDAYTTLVDSPLDNKCR